MKYGLREERFELGIFDFTVVFVFGDFKNLERYLQWKFENKNLKVETPECIPFGRTSRARGFVPVVWMPRFPRTVREIATLAHECSHVMTEVIYWLEVNNESQATDEIRAHGISYLVKSILAKRKK